MQYSVKRAEGSDSFLVVDLGRTRYDECWNLQNRVFHLRSRKIIPDTLLLTEHDHVYTIGRTGDVNHLLASATTLAARGIPLVHNDRGGDITYHGPGQFVGYPIFDLHNYYLDLHRYLRDLEDVIIRALQQIGLVGKRLEGYTGVWVDGEKICAIGIKTSRWVTMHGFALNVNTDLSYFDRIIPCGIFERGVTSVQRKLRRTVETAEIANAVVSAIEDVFGVKRRDVATPRFLEIVGAGELDRKSPALSPVT